MVDILHKGKDGWEVYEVKSSTGIYEKNKSANLLTQYKHDISVQYYVLNGQGLEISKICMVHINNKYVRHGELDIKQLFNIEDCTAIAIESQTIVREDLARLRESLDGGEPNIDIGPHCSNPYPCDFREHCWKHIPANSVFDIAGLQSKKKFELYYQGIVKFEDIPSDISLNQKQQLQVDAELHGKEIIDKDGIKSFLSQIEEPIGFLDFETFKEAIPSFDKQRPYQQIPFQYSLHILEDHKLEHFEYLGEPGNDPRQELIDGIIAHSNRCKTMLVYNKSFEITRMNELAADFPDRAEELNRIINMVVDQMEPFKAKHYYTKEMKGRWKIKLVLPALVPELKYSDLDISDGGMAMNSYAKLHKMTNSKEIKKIRMDLLEYCRLDTFGMVKILEKMKSVV